MELRNEIKKALASAGDNATLDDVVQLVEAAVVKSLGTEGLLDLARQIKTAERKAYEEAGLIMDTMEQRSDAPTAQDWMESIGAAKREAAETRWSWSKEQNCWLADPKGDLIIYGGATPDDLEREAIPLVRMPDDDAVLSGPIARYKADVEKMRDEFTWALQQNPPAWAYAEQLDAAIKKSVDLLRGRVL